MLERDLLLLLVGTALGFLLAVAWDRYKNYVDSKEKRARCLSALANELLENRAWIENALGIIETNRRESYKEQVHYGMNVPSIEAWRQLGLVMGPSAFSKSNHYVQVARLYRSLSYLREQIQAREDQRLHRESFTNYAGRMQYMDQWLENWLRKHLRTLNEVYGLLKEEYVRKLDLPVYDPEAPPPPKVS